MTYEIRNLKPDDLKRIYPTAEEDAIRKIASSKRQWLADMPTGRWCVDESDGAFLVRLPMSREDPMWRYMFGINGGVAIVRNESYCLFSFLYMSPALSGRVDEVKSRMRSMFKVAGMAIDGTTDENSILAVPSAQFKD